MSKFSKIDKFESIRVEPINKKEGALPRSIGRTINKIKTQLDPSSETKLIENFRSSRKTTRQAINLILLLIIVPLLTQKLSKEFIILPKVTEWRNTQATEIFINPELKEKALAELHTFEEELKFQALLKHEPFEQTKEVEEKISKKVEELAEEFKQEGNHAISNVFADLLAFGAFLIVLWVNPKGVIAIKVFLNDIIYDLSDSAKAFILILFTDIFVGFHSPHGWEVLLESIASHLGIAPNHHAIFLFIATFPVILDTVFKYWIFRYLNQISPSAVATLKNMNE